MGATGRRGDSAVEFFFVHINKTAGSSIEESLGIRFRHRTARQIIAEVGLEKWRNSFTFTVVRNPWDKVVSHYSYRVQTDQTGMGDGSIAFAEWVREAYGRRNPRYYDKPKMFMPQVDWISGADGSILVNFIARFETLQTDFNTVCARIGRDPAELPHRKSSQRGDYRGYYDAETRGIVNDWFRRDVERFGYEF
ncbi:MAG: sulfotransferase family 2 domain-containing protein [Gammaproteobacteria bacterium]|nr:sulfotransferase family 2 domain-containing protein [Gammaproteobacteria bacterium]